MASRGLRKAFFFHLKACERRNFDFYVFLRVDSLPGGRVWPGVTRALRPFTLYKPVLYIFTIFSLFFPTSSLLSRLFVF